MVHKIPTKNDRDQHKNAALNHGHQSAHYSHVQHAEIKDSNIFLGLCNFVTGLDMLLFLFVGVVGIVWSYRKDLVKSDYSDYKACLWTCVGCTAWLCVHMIIRFFVGYRDFILAREFILGFIILILFGIWSCVVLTDSDSLDDIKTKLRGYAYSISGISLIMISDAISHAKSIPLICNLTISALLVTFSVFAILSAFSEYNTTFGWSFAIGLTIFIISLVIFIISLTIFINPKIFNIVAHWYKVFLIFWLNIGCLLMVCNSENSMDNQIVTKWISGVCGILAALLFIFI